MLKRANILEYMKIISWNVNGIRSVFKTTFKDWLKANDPDIICLQEVKAEHSELTEEFTEIEGYYAYFNPKEFLDALHRTIC